MKYILEFNKFNNYENGDIVLIHYWYDFELTPVKIIDNFGNKFKITHNIEGSKIFNSPDEFIKKSEILKMIKKNPLTI